MASQGPRFPATAASLANAGTSENAEAWVNPTNIFADDGSEATIVAATYDTPDISQLLVASNFGFTIPDGARIDGITVEIERRDQAIGAASDNRVQLSKTTTFAGLVGTNKADLPTDWPTAVAIATYGSATDTWSAGLTYADVNSSSFAVMLSVQADAANTDIFVDYIRVTVTYTDITHMRSRAESFPPGRKMPRLTLLSAQDFQGTPPAAGNTYTPTGALVAGVVLAGVDVFEAAEAGSLIADTLLAGADVFEATRAGSLTPDTTLSGVRVLTYNRLGSLTPDTTLSGTDSFNPAETGSLVSAALLSGADVFTASETGSLIADTLLAGARSVTFNRAGSLTPDTLLAGADVFEAAEAGALAASARLFGADVFTAAEAGSLFTQTSLSGADVFTAAETGTLMAFGFLAGVGTKEGAYIKAGSLTPGSQLYGADAFTANRLGALFAAALVSGTRSRDRERTGALTPDTSVTGADVFTAAEVGSLVALATLVGGRTATFNRAGALSTNALLAGVGLLASSLTMLDPIYTGRIGQTLFGTVPDEAGVIGDTVAGLYVPEQRPEGGQIGDTVAGLVEEDHEE